MIVPNREIDQIGHDDIVRRARPVLPTTIDLHRVAVRAITLNSCRSSALLPPSPSPARRRHAIARNLKRRCVVKRRLARQDASLPATSVTRAVTGMRKVLSPVVRRDRDRAEVERHVLRRRSRSARHQCR
jgi:hypothetical protein